MVQLQIYCKISTLDMATNATDRLLKLIHGYCRLGSGNMNIIDGIIGIILEFHQIAKWSNSDEHKGSGIELKEDDSKAVCVDESNESSVRAAFSIERGEIISWELECYQPRDNCYFYGVIPSKQGYDFNECPAYNNLKDCYGIDDYQDIIYLGKGGTNSLGHFAKPGLPVDKVFVLRMTADWTDKQCKLSIFYQGKKNE